jgi:hypothetical protein
MLPTSLPLWLAIGLAAGCSSSNSLSGSVTCGDKPVAHGAISLRPADGQGPTAGAAITGGRFRIDRLTPGKKIVQIVATSRDAAPTPGRNRPPAVIQRASRMASDLVPSPRNVTVRSGHQTMDFRLISPENP